MKINIVCTDEGWIYSKFIEEFKKHSRHEIVLNSKEKCDVVHYLPYYEAPKNPSKPSTCWLSHQEKGRDLSKKFVDAAKSVDVSLSQSRKYATMLRDNHQCQNVMSIMAGTDLKVFKLRSAERDDNPKIVVGHVGRRYSSSNRKNPDLIKKISEIPFVDFRPTDGKLDKKDIPGFYRQLDVTISPATIEGGPMCIQESLACGVPVVSMKDVGVTNEFGDGVIKAENNNDFVAKLKDMYLSKQYLTHWRQPSVMKGMRTQVEPHTWEKFVESHDKVWEMITANSWRKSNE